jgi:branched-chain amino acid transport system ATP-binding protein
MGKPLLEVQRLSKSFGRVVTAHNLDLAFEPGVLTSIIGPNGAGKSTLINMLSGSLSPDSGRILLEGREITDLPTHRRVQLGLCRSFQVVNVFPQLSVFDNVQIPILAMHGRAPRFFRPVSGEQRVRRECEELLLRIGLGGEKARRMARELSHGDQRLLEVGIALAARPKILFLDEPTAGMNPVERVRVLDIIKNLSQEGKTTFVIVEHDMDIVFSLSERVIVLHHGLIIGDGTTEEIKNNPRVREVYLGEEVAS